MTQNVIDDPMLDEEWLAAPAKRSRLRLVLVVVLAAAACFLGGALVQKNLGGAETASGAAAGPAGLGGGQLPEGLPEGGFPAGAPGDMPGGNAEQDASGDAEGSDSESVIGEVVEIRGDVWIVEDLGGNRHEVKVGDGTDIVRETEVDAADVHVGDPVDIAGTASNDQIDASDIILR